MTETNDLDRLIARIRQEARRRGDENPFHERTYHLLELRRQDMAAAASSGATEGVAVGHVREWTALHGQAFLKSAYRTLLRRQADSSGLSHFGKQIAEGRLTRWEVAVALRMSPEGREHGVNVPGLRVAYAFVRVYRLPLMGPIAALMANLLRLPNYLIDNRRLELLIAQLLASRV